MYRNIKTFVGNAREHSEKNITGNGNVVLFVKLYEKNTERSRPFPTVKIFHIFCDTIKTIYYEARVTK
jgi:hypothetical protein